MIMSKFSDKKLNFDEQQKMIDLKNGCNDEYDKQRLLKLSFYIQNRNFLGQENWSLAQKLLMKVKQSELSEKISSLRKTSFNFRLKELLLIEAKNEESNIEKIKELHKEHLFVVDEHLFVDRQYSELTKISDMILETIKEFNEVPA